MNIVDTKVRLDYIDVSKGIGILLVVFYHCIISGTSNCMPVVSNIITSFFMPLFFFLSGYLYKKKPTKHYFYGKTKSLLIPLIIIYVFNFFTEVFFSVLGYSTNYFELKGYWFIEDLLYISIFYYLFNCFLDRVIKNKKIVHIVLLFVSCVSGILGLLFDYITGGGNPSIISAFIGVMYYSIGHQFRRYEEERINISNRYIIGATGLIFIFIVSFLSQKIGGVSMAYNKYGNIYLFLICSILGSFGILFVSKMINKSKLFSYFGTNSLIILSTQFPLYNNGRLILEYISNNYFQISEFAIVLLDFVITVLCEILVITFVNKCFPLFAGRIKSEVLE